MTALLDELQAWPGARWLQASGTAWMLVNASHLLGIVLLLGSILPLDLRLLAGRERLPLSAPTRAAIRTAALGLVLAIATGLWMFSAQPREYLGNAAFAWKLALVAVALANVAAQHRLLGRTRIGLPPIGVRALAALSSLLWLATLLAGRWIGFL